MSMTPQQLSTQLRNALALDDPMLLRAVASDVAEALAEKRAPVQGWPQGIPWSLHLEAYAAYCKRYGPQPALIDLEGRHCRGGFGTGELDDFIPGWRERASEIVALRAENVELHTKLKTLTSPIPHAITASAMINEDPKAFCVMAAYRTAAEAETVFRKLAPA